MADSLKTPGEFIQLSSERRQRNKNNLQCFRRRCKRKLSLVSDSSMNSTSSVGMEQCSFDNDGSARCSSNLVKDQTVQPLTSHLLEDFPTALLADMNRSGTTSDDDDDVSSNGCSSSSTSSDENFTEDDFNKFRTSTHLSDHRPLHSHTTSSVQDFSIDVLEFCRSSRVPKNQRSCLLDLFRRYLPSPNLVPLSADSLGGKCLILSRHHLLPSKKERYDEKDDLVMASFVEQSRVSFLRDAAVPCVYWKAATLLLSFFSIR